MLDFDELEEIETQLRASFPDVKTDQAPWMITTLQVFITFRLCGRGAISQPLL